MPRSTKLEQYPARYQDILEDVSSGGVVEVECESEADARRLRGHWFSFMSVISKHARLLELREQKGLATISPDQLRVRQWDRFRGMVQCVQEGTKVRWQPYNRSWAAQQLERAKFIVPPPEAPAIEGGSFEAEVAESEARMRKLLEEGK